ncbi:ATP-binding protein [Actinokineospora inagensis]|uniref:ATP-binding protein n=1 Tax=Actinokineospora inagensis TaxID=103730 RepID=UPI0012FB509C|nr:ATP-binding protein [Actinokineospora inagensis]
MTEDAQAAMNRLLAWIGPAMRGVTAVAGGVAAVAGAAPPVTLGWVVPAASVSLVWSAVFAWVALVRGLRGWLLVVDMALTTALCLLQPHLVSPPLLSGGLSWIDGLTSMTIVLANFVWRPGVAVPAGLLVAAAHLVGAWSAAPWDTLGIHLIQVAATAALMTLLRNAATLADTALADLRETERTAEVMRARRADERAHNRKLHDTVLATLTTIGTHGITATSPALRTRAAEDLAVIEGMAEPGEPDTTVDLRHQLRAVADKAVVTVETDLVPCKVPVRVAVAFADAAAEALTNVARHAGVSTARLEQQGDCASVVVVVSDSGSGFDPGTVPLYRYGVREGIIGRMRAVEGDATITSTSAGTTITLRWPG